MTARHGSSTVTSISISCTVDRSTTSLGCKSEFYDAVAHLDRWGGELLPDWGLFVFGSMCHRGGVLSTPGPEDLYVSYPFGVCGVVVVSPSFRGVSCSVPCFPLLKKAFCRTRGAGFAQTELSVAQSLGWANKWYLRRGASRPCSRARLCLSSSYSFSLRVHLKRMCSAAAFFGPSPAQPVRRRPI